MKPNAMQKTIPSNTLIDIEIQIKQERAAKKIIEAHRKREKKAKLSPYRVGDGKTIFYCATPERGAAAVTRYQNKLKQYK